ncbi:unnamed protein product, partial [Meganyctiphanes norvegica]
MDDLECEICCERYDEEDRRPKCLTCGHSFCQECMERKIANGKSTCPTYRKPHNAKSAGEIAYNVTLERVIRNRRIRSLCTSEADDEEDKDYSGGLCPTHTKCVAYFWSLNHAVKVCRECTVIDHPITTCKVISFKEELERRKEDNIRQASSTVTDLDDTLSAMDEIAKEKEDIIAKLKREIEEASKTIAKENVAFEKLKKEMAHGKVKKTEISSAKQNLLQAKNKKTIGKGRIEIETASVAINK